MYLQKLEKFVIYDYISLNLEPAQVSIKFTIFISIDKAYQEIFLIFKTSQKNKIELFICLHRLYKDGYNKNLNFKSSKKNFDSLNLKSLINNFKIYIPYLVIYEY